MNRREWLSGATALAAAGSARAGERQRAGDVVFVITFELKPGAEAEFLGLLEPVLDAMRREATFVNAALHQDPDDATRFMLYETWSDLADVRDIQVHRPYRRAFWDRLPALLRSPRRLETWRPLRGDFTFF